MNRDIRLRIEGSLLERLIQRALREGASFARIRRSEKRVILVDADEHSAEILTRLCERFWLDCRVLRRGGGAALMDTLRRRWTVAPGLLLCALTCALFLSRIWMVDVSFTGPSAAAGNERAIRECLADNGVSVGMAATAVDTNLLQAELMAEAGDFSFIGVRRQGIRLLVEASPEVAAPELYELGYARDLVAARDGVVESVNVHSGQACVKAGDTVRAGQVLIRGEEDLTKEETTPVGALGEVIARCWYEGSAEGELSRTAMRRTGNVDMESTLSLMGFALPLTGCDGYAAEETELEILPVGGLFLPLEIRRTVHYETAPVREEADAAQLEVRLAALALSEARSKLARDGIAWQDASAWTDAERNGNTLRVRAVYEIYTDIAVTRDALREGAP